MTCRFLLACLVVVAAPCAVAAPVSRGNGAAPVPKKTSHADPAATARAKLEATRGQAKVEDAQVKQLKVKVDAAESRSATSAQELAERDRKIAELQRQLAAERHP